MFLHQCCPDGVILSVMEHFFKNFCKRICQICTCSGCWIDWFLWSILSTPAVVLRRNLSNLHMMWVLGWLTLHMEHFVNPDCGTWKESVKSAHDVGAWLIDFPHGAFCQPWLWYLEGICQICTSSGCLVDWFSSWSSLLTQLWYLESVKSAYYINAWFSLSILSIQLWI